MKRGFRNLGRIVWRLAASWLLLLGILELGKRVSYVSPRGRWEPADVTPRVETQEYSRVAVSPISTFEMAGVPMAMTTRAVSSCDAQIWSPQEMPEWSSDSWLLELERAPDRVVAVWLEWGGALEAAVHHSVQLDCTPDGHGALHHTWIVAARGLRDPDESWRGRADGSWAGPFAGWQRAATPFPKPRLVDLRR